MKTIINKPIAETYGWLHAGGTAVDLPEEPAREVFSLAPGETKTVVRTDADLYVRYEAELPEGASLHFIEIKNADGPEMTHADIHAVCGKDAHFRWTRLLFDGQATYDNCSAELAGEGSSFTADIGYRLSSDHIYDVNCEAIHTGKRTESRILSSGVLADEADKLLRGTIDFRNGCAGAVGNESEEVLLLSENIRNRSVPVILCDEEDVVGNHGASIGRPDENLLYYMESRGLRADEAVELLAAAKLAAVVNRIPDEKIREEIREKYL
jgi:Fe-S cluster assembly scaffold protein SufB